MAERVKSFQIIPNDTIQSGGNYTYSINRLLRILKIFKTLSLSRAFNDDFHLLRRQYS